MESQAYITQLHDARTPREQMMVLKALKNELIGHPLKKQTAVASGVLEPIARWTFNKAGATVDGAKADSLLHAASLTDEEQVRLYGLQVLGSIALGEVTRHFTCNKH